MGQHKGHHVSAETKAKTRATNKARAERIKVALEALPYMEAMANEIDELKQEIDKWGKAYAWLKKEYIVVDREAERLAKENQECKRRERNKTYEGLGENFERESDPYAFI
jgi:phosphopantetheine adenylyltransferase